MGVSFNSKERGAVKTRKISNQNSDFTNNNFQKIINALEIDWNGAVLPDGNPSTGGSTNAINDTADILELINSMQKEIYVLTAAVVALAQK